MKRTLILGPPGTGKTTRLLQEVDRYLSQGVKPEEIAFVSFTKRAVTEAIDRACNNFNLKPEQLKYFRTIHSLAFEGLGLQPNRVLQNKHLEEFGELVGHEISTRIGNDGNLRSATQGEQMLFIDNLARLTRRPVSAIYGDCDLEVNWHELKRFYKAYYKFKEANDLLDFSDMLVDYAESCFPIPVKIALIDEAQDLNPIQWEIVQEVFSMSEVIIAGDDDQAIYSWAGADVEYFLNLKVDETVVLDKSYRVPRAIRRMADTIVQRIPDRYEKDWVSADIPGMVRTYSDESHVDLGDEEWLILARNKIHLRRVKELLHYAGYVYMNKTEPSVDPNDLLAIEGYTKIQRGRSIDRKTMNQVRNKFGFNDIGEKLWYEVPSEILKWRLDYYLSILRNERKLTDTPKIRVDTIHGSKGAESKNVMIFTDVQKSAMSSEQHRVFYVGVTRTKDKLHIILPHTGSFYKL